jgi:hypothetical protein
MEKQTNKQTEKINVKEEQNRYGETEKQTTK